jgi:hypothetical protein
MTPGTVEDVAFTNDPATATGKLAALGANPAGSYSFAAGDDRDAFGDAGAICR